MLSEKQVLQIREELDFCKRPIFFFHDDPDGLCSFLLLYRHINEGKGIVIKTTPRITQMFARKAEEYGADKVFVLDIAMVDQEFIDAVKVPVVWIDHHEPVKRDNVKYFNPRLNGENIPPSRICYDVVKKDIWIAMAGCISDWHMPFDLKEEFCKNYPGLMDASIDRPEEALFNTKIGQIAKIMSFNLKGSTQDVMKSAKIFTRIESPEELLEQTTSKGKFVYKRYTQVEKEYAGLLEKALKSEAKGKIILFAYSHDKMSLTKDMSNELLYRNPDKVIVIGREKSGEVKCSIRAGKDTIISKALEKALVGIEGYGGGHEHACGAVVKKEDFEKFIDNLNEAVK